MKKILILENADAETDMKKILTLANVDAEIDAMKKMILRNAGAEIDPIEIGISKKKEIGRGAMQIITLKKIATEINVQKI